MRKQLLWLALVLGAAVLPLAARATTVRPPSFDQLVEKADAVVRGEVTAVRSEWRGTGEERRIATLVTLRVKEVLVGDVPETVELEFFGGQVGTRRIEIAGMPRFAVGDDDFLFVQNNGAQVCPLVAMNHGRYLVADAPVPAATATAGGGGGGARQIVARANGVPLESVSEVEQPLAGGEMAKRLAAMKRGGLSPEEFGAEVRAAATRAGRTDVRAAAATTSASAQTEVQQ